MSNTELKGALLSGCPVEYGEIRYRCVSEIVYRCRAGKIVVTAGLLDKNGSCLVYAPAAKVNSIQEETA